MKRFLANRSLAIGMLLSAAVILPAALSLVWTPWDPDVMNPGERLRPPGAGHLLGTDQYGRDMLSRIMRGAAGSMAVGLATVAMGMSAGVLLGMLAAYCRGWVDEAVMRLADLLFGFPAVLSAILITSVLGPSALNAMLAIGIFYIPVFARLARATALSIWELDFVAAARVSGLGDLAIARRHVLPNIMPALIVQATIQFAVAILAEAGLSYLGLGTQPPDASWGRMLNEAQTFMPIAPWTAVFPGLAICLAVLGFSLLGDGLRDTLDPRLARR